MYIRNVKVVFSNENQLCISGEMKLSKRTIKYVPDCSSMLANMLLGRLTTLPRHKINDNFNGLSFHNFNTEISSLNAIKKGEYGDFVLYSRTFYNIRINDWKLTDIINNNIDELALFLNHKSFENYLKILSL